MEKKRVLVVDDEQDLCEILCFNLTAAGYDAESACSAEEALQNIEKGKTEHRGTFDLLLLDVMMPGMSGFELAERLKGDIETARIPLIFLTAKDSEDDTLQGFSIGADDYVTKPFSVREVMARVKAVLSRANQEHPLVHEGLKMDNVGKTVFVDGVEAALTRTEFDLLRLLLSHRGEVFSRQQLLDSVWPRNVIVTGRSVDVGIARLRKKIGRYGTSIVARQGFGYVFEE